MKNIDKMKQNIVKQIENMSVEEFEKFASVLDGSTDMPKGLIDTSVLFDCVKCQKTYSCSGEDDDFEQCSNRFREYALREEK